MKLFKVSFDAVTICLFAEDEKDAFVILEENDFRFFEDKEKGYCYRWDKDLYDTVSILEVVSKRGIFHETSH